MSFHLLQTSPVIEGLHINPLQQGQHACLHTAIYFNLFHCVSMLKDQQTYMTHRDIRKNTSQHSQNEKKPLCDSGTSKLRDLRVFRPAFKGCNCALTLSLDQWLSNLLPCCALSCLEGCNGHLSFITRSVGFSCNGPLFYPCHL